MICPKCGTENPNELIFCKSCGENLTQTNNTNSQANYNNMDQQNYNQNGYNNPGNYQDQNSNNPYNNQNNPYGNQYNPYNNQNDPYNNQNNPYGNQYNPYNDQNNPYGNPYNNYNQTKPVEYAGFWRRFAAYIIDSLIIGIPTNIIQYAILGVSPTSSSTQVTNLLNTNLSEYLGVYFITIVITLLYFALMESSKYQATLGKMVLGIKVTDLNGDKISLGRAIGRYLGKIISGFIFCIGFMMAGFTEKKQALHDMIASTLVVMK